MLQDELILFGWFAVLGGSIVGLSRFARATPVSFSLLAPMIGIAVSGVISAMVVLLDPPRILWMVLGGGAACGAAAVLYLVFRRKLVAAVSVIVAASAIGLVGVVVLYFTLAPILTFDSYQFVIYGRALRVGDLMLDGPTVASFPLLMGHVQALARGIDLDYSVYAVGVASCLAIFGALGVAIQAAVPSPEVRERVWLTSGAILGAVMLGIYTLRIQLTYLNSHLVAAALFATALALTLRVRGEDRRGGTMLLIALCLAGLSLARIEGLLVVVLLVVFIVDVAAPSGREVLLLAAVGIGPPAAWYGSLIANGAESHIFTPDRGVFLLALPVVALCTAFLPAGGCIRRLIPIGAQLALAMAVVGLLWVSPDTAPISLVAFLGNAFVSGGWGTLWWIVVPLAVTLVVSTRRTRLDSAWGVVLLGFVLMVVALGGIRSTPYRLGWGDSANRMLVHVVPALMIYFVVRLVAVLRLNGARGDEGRRASEVGAPDPDLLSTSGNRPSEV